MLIIILINKSIEYSITQYYIYILHIRLSLAQEFIADHPCWPAEPRADLPSLERSQSPSGATVTEVIHQLPRSQLLSQLPKRFSCGDKIVIFRYSPTFFVGVLYLQMIKFLGLSPRYLKKSPLSGAGIPNWLLS